MPAFALAQGSGFDVMNYSEEDITGSSRYVGMGGAMAALGGDVSAVKDNPAGLGVFRRSELTLSLGMDFGQIQRVELPALNWVCNFGTYRNRGLITNSLMFSYERLRSYGADYNLGGKNLTTSQTDVMALLSEGLTYADMREGTNAGWLSWAGFDAYLIDTLPGQPTQWASLEPGNVDAQLRVTESGYSDDYSVAWGANFNNKLYVGMRVNLRTANYQKQYAYSEQFESENSYVMRSSLNASTLGIGGSLGLIWRPVEAVRLAAAFQTPTLCTTQYNYRASIESRVEQKDYASQYNLNNASPLTEHTPWRVVGGMAFNLGRSGLFSLDYCGTYRKEVGIRSQHLLKMGGEWAITNHLFWDFGYAMKLYGPYAKGEEVYRPDWTSIRVDTDQRKGDLKHWVSTGFSYRGRIFAAGMAYQYSRQDYHVWAHELAADPLGTYSQQTHRIVLTLGFRYTR